MPEHQLPLSKAFSLPNGTNEPESRISPLIESIRAVMDRIDDINKEAEPAFLKLGMDLQSFYAKSDQVTRLTQSAVKETGIGTEDNFLSRLNQLIDHSLKDMTQFLRETDEAANVNLNQAEEIIIYLKQLNKICLAIIEIAKTIMAIGLNIRIKTSRSEEYEEMFRFIAQDIQKYSTRVIEIANIILKDSKEAKDKLNTITLRIKAVHQKMSQLTHETQEAVTDAMERIENLIARFFEMLRQTEGDAQSISLEVGKIVVGIQFHDNMSQRIAHILTAYEDVTRILEKKRKGEEGPLKLPQTVHHIAKLQTAQLKQINADLAAVYTKNLNAFNEVASTVKTMTLKIVPEKESQKGGGNRPKGDPIRFLKASLEQLKYIFSQSNQLSDQLNETANESSAIAEKLFQNMEHVRGINTETNLLAYNAIIQASHLKNG